MIASLKLPLESMDNFTFEQFGWLYEYHYEQKKEEYEVLAHVISVGYARTQTKKKINLFDDKQKVNKTNTITNEEREIQINFLLEKFN